MNTASEQQPANVARIGRGDGDVLEILGIHCEWKIRESDTGGHYCVLEMHVPPSAGVPSHQHAQQETFVVVEGTAEFGRLAGEEVEWIGAKPGDTMNVPSWAIHGFRNTSAAPARILLICAQGIEPFFNRAGIPVVPGTPLPTSPPTRSDIERVLAIAIADGQRFL